MKRIVGIAGFEPGRFSRKDLDGMIAPLSRRGFRNSRRWTGNRVLLAEVDNGELPSETPSIPVVADARLDERVELAGRLGIAPGQQIPGDTELIWQAWRRWGERCVDYLLGDFAFAIWDEDCHRLFIARDHIGCKPMYYSQGDGWFAFASEPKSLLALDVVDPVLNRSRIADLLVSQLEDIGPRESFYAQITRLLPAHCLDSQDARVRQERYWTLGRYENVSTDPAERSEQFIDLFRCAVDSRISADGRTAVMLSGGMDSSSIIALAHSGCLQPGKSFGTVSAVSPDGSGGETAAINAVAHHFELDRMQVDPGRFAQNFSSPIEFLNEVDDLFDSSMVTLNAACAMEASGSGASSLVDGIDGDLVAGYTGPAAVSNAAISGSLNMTMEELRYIAGESGFGMGSACWSHVVRPLGSALVPLRLKRPLLRRRASQQFDEVLVEAGISRGFAEESRLVERLTELDLSLPRSLSHGRTHRQAVQHFYLMSGVERYERCAAYFGLEARHPMLDTRFVEFCVSLPPFDKCHLGNNKVLMRQAMRDFLPRVVVERPYSPHESLFTMFREAWLLEHRTELAQRFESHSHLLTDYVAPERIADTQRKLDPGFGGDGAELDENWTIIALCMWLARDQ